jgi:hydroxymethylglutaryl-CoA synthase
VTADVVADPTAWPGTPSGVHGDVGIMGLQAYLPWHRLTGDEIGRSLRRPAQPAQRRLAGPDEDSLTMAVAAAQQLPDSLISSVRSLVFCSTTPPYAGKNNASAAHAATGLGESVLAFDGGISFRATMGAMLTSVEGTLLLCGEVSTARTGASAELEHGDGAAAVLMGPADQSITRIADAASVSEELLDHWRIPEEPWLSASEPRFVASRYLPMIKRVSERLRLKSADHVIISSPSKAGRRAAEKVLTAIGPVRGTPGVGFTGSADPLVQLAAVLADAAPGDTILVASLTDGCDLMLLQCSEYLAAGRPQRLRAADEGPAPAYVDALTWRGLLEREPPRRPQPGVVSPPASARAAGWKYSLRGSQCGGCGAVGCPPQEICVRCGSAHNGRTVDLSRRGATIRSFSVDRLAFSSNPPVIAAVIDFDGGGRLEVELTDTNPDTLAVGSRVRMSFRLLHSSGGIRNYSWKAVPEEPAHG